MKTMMLVGLLVLLIGSGFAQSAEEYCASEHAEGESCYRSCCEMLGYSWTDGGCGVPESEQGYVAEQCGYCTDSYMQCVSNYEQAAAGAGSYSEDSSSSSGGCCGSAMILLAVPLLAAFRR